MNASLFATVLATLLTGSAGYAQTCPGELPTRLFGWYGDERGEVLVYPPGNGTLGVFDRRARRTTTAQTLSGAGIAELSDGRSASFRLEDCASATQLNLHGEGAARTLERLPDPYDLHALAFENNGTQLAALLLMRGDPAVGVVMIHGSGDSDRDNGAYLTIADALARAGLAVVLPDKRGAGASGGEWREAGFALLAQDALAGVQQLDSRLHGETSMGLLGISQGGWVAAIAAAQSPAVDFAVTVVAPVVTLREQQVYVIRKLATSAGLNEPLQQQLVELVRAAAAYSLEGGEAAWKTYSSRRAKLAGTRAEPLLESFPTNRDHWTWSWGRRVLDVDPADSWSEFEGPLLALFAGSDVYVPVERSTRRLSAAAPQAEIHVFDGLGHSLADPEEGVIDDRVLAVLLGWTESIVQE